MSSIHLGGGVRRQARQPEDQAILAKRKLVFVVDDDASVLKSIQRLLIGHGFSARVFASGVALLDHDDFDEAFCIILDVNLNDQSGIDLRTKLTAQGVVAPVIFITGTDTPTKRSAAMRSGCIAYLTKPFSAPSLIEPVTLAFAAA
jgi:FixJ family two-component response regulator